MRIKWVIFSLLIIITLGAFIPTACAKDYSLPQVKINALIRADGSVEFNEERTFDFQGSFSFGYYELPKKGFSQLTNLLVLLDGKPLIQYPSRETGTFFVEDLGNSYKIHYFYQAYNEKKTFTFKYTLRDLISVYQDYGQFYFKLQGTGWDKPIGDFQARINFDFAVPVEDYRVWAHGPLWGEIKKLDERSVLVSCSDVPANTYIEARILIPTSFFKVSEVLSTTIGDIALREEKAWADQANRRRIFSRFLTTYVPYLALLIVLALSLNFLRLYKYYGAEFNLPRNFVYVREPPTTHKPGIVAGLLNFNAFNPNSLQATIMDLIYRGFIDMEEVEVKSWLRNRKDYRLILRDPFKLAEEVKLLESESASVDTIKEPEIVEEKVIIDPGKLDNFETTLLAEVLFAEEEAVLISQLKTKFKKRPKFYQTALDKFKNQLQKKVSGGGFYDSKSQKMSIYVIIGGFFIFVLSLITAGFLLNPAMLLLLIPAALYIVGGLLAIPRRSLPGKEKYDLWMGFRAFLKDFSNLKQYGPQSIVLWEKYLVYGTVLGVSRQVLRALKVAIPEIKDLENARIFKSIVIAQNWTAGPVMGFNQAFSSLENALRGLNQVARSSYSSGSGGGGGFSGGGGGGGGGSGGGVG